MHRLGFRGAVVVVVLATLLAIACSNAPTYGTSNSTNHAQTYLSNGVIKSTDRENGMATVDHEDVPGYMAAMEMTLKVSDRAMLERVKAGDVVEFELFREGSTLTITKLKKVGETAVVNGSAIFTANCAECHGDKGEGAQKGISLVKGHALDHSEAEHLAQVRDGKKKMPAFRNKLTEAEIAAVVKFVRETLQSGKPRNEGHRH